MRSNELRIGNWVQCAIIKIGSLKKGDFHQLEIDDFNYNLEDYFRPIPLTEEWSVKFGYECLVDMACDFSCKSLYPIEITSEDLKLMKVNEAQNLYLDLTGKELTIKE